MNKKINTLAFSLIELLVWMSIITIVILWSSNLWFKNMSDRQKLEIFNNKIIWEIEEVRNNSLIWKWFWVNLTVPLEWKIDFSRNNSWIVKTSYTNDWTNRIEKNNLDIDDLMNISSISCKSVSGTTNTLSATQTWTIFFKWWKYILWWNCPTAYSNLIIQTFNKWYYKSVEFDVISWLIKK